MSNMTPGQLSAAQYLSTMHGRSGADYVGASNQDTIMSDPQIQAMLQSSEGTYSPGALEALIAQRTAALSTQGSAAMGQSTYDDYLKGANANVDFWNQHPQGMENDWMDSFMYNVFPAVMAAVVGAGAAGVFGDAAAAGSAGATGGGAGFGAAGADVGLGNMAINGGALQGLGDLTGAASAGAGTAAGAGGLGSMIGVAGGAPAVVSVGAPAAATGGGIGLGGMAAGGGMAITAADLAGIDQAAGGIDPGMKPNPALDNVNPVADGAAGLPIPSTSGGLGNLLQNGLPSGVTGLLNGVGSLVGGNVDRIKAQQDSDWWKSQLDTLQGMYKPGTPEATLMEQKMNAKDAAAGRNSQYGVRATDLAAQLATQRSGIMTSAGYQNMANAYRNRSSQDLNGLFSAAGQGGGLGSTISNGISGINSIYNMFTGSGNSVPKLGG